MIKPDVVAEVRHLLFEGRHSQRQIARLVGLSRGTVGTIASGRRRDVPTEPCEEDATLWEGPPVRCPDCGALVYIPCVLCRVRKKLGKRRRVVDCRPEPIRLDLRPEHRARYEEVRRWRKENIANCKLQNANCKMGRAG